MNRVKLDDIDYRVMTYSYSRKIKSEREACEVGAFGLNRFDFHYFSAGVRAARLTGC